MVTPILWLENNGLGEEKKCYTREMVVENIEEVAFTTI